MLKRRVGVVWANGKRGRSRSRESGSLRKKKEDRETTPRPGRESASVTLVIGLHSKKVRLRRDIEKGEEKDGETEERKSRWTTRLNFAAPFLYLAFLLFCFVPIIPSNPLTCYPHSQCIYVLHGHTTIRHSHYPRPNRSIASLARAVPVSSPTTSRRHVG